MKFQTVDKTNDEIVLEKGGEHCYVRVGNSVVDIMHGYNHSGRTEPCVFVEVYPYEDKKETHLHFTDDRAIIVSR